MAGLKRNSNASALIQWRQLFVNQHAEHSAEACAHWLDVERLGLPTNQQEHWKYTPLDRFLEHRFVSANNCIVSDCLRDMLSLKINACRIVFVNGRFNAKLSNYDTDIWQIKIEKGADRQSLPKPIQPEIFLHLTESLSKEITRIRLPAGKIAQRPLYLLHISQGSENEETLSTIHYRHHIDIEPNAQGQVIEHFTSIDNYGHFSGARITLSVGNQAILNHIKLAFENQTSYHFSHNDIIIGQNSIVHSNTFIIGTKLTKHQTSVQLNGESSNLAVNSLLLPSGYNVSDIRTYIEHNKGRCFSRQRHKMVISDHAKGIFNGLIRVARHALKTDSKIINNNLLLHNKSEVYTKPQLEVYADDVKCSHGVTIGQINEEQIFYLLSRGINHKDAKQIMIYAFISELIESINYKELCNIILARIADVLKEALL